MNAVTLLSGLLPDSHRLEREAAALVELNAKTSPFRLTLTPEQALETVRRKNLALAENSRLELGTKTLERLMETFSRSPYAEPSSWSELLGGLCELFYYVKTETSDALSDVELAAFMREKFDGVCGGSMSLLTDECERKIREIKGFEPEKEDLQ